MTEQDKQALIKHFCERDCGEEFAKECAIMPCHEIELIQEFPTTEAGSDTISRQAAIEAVEFGITYAKAINKETGEVTALFEESNAELQEAADRIKQLPPAQPVIVPCDYAKACNEVAMNRITSAVVYMEILEDFKEYGYVLVDMREVTEHG